MNQSISGKRKDIEKSKPKITENIAIESSLIERFEASNDFDVKLAAQRQIQDEAFHIKVVQGNYEPELRQASAGHIRNQDILEELFKSESDLDVRHIILNKIKNQDMFTELAYSNADTESRSIAISRLRDGKVLAELALDDSQPKILRQASLTRLIKLKDISSLEQVFKGLEDGFDKTNVASVLKQLGSTEVNDWIHNQRIKTDARQVQSLLAKGDSSRAKFYSDVSQKINSNNCSQPANKTTQQDIYNMACKLPEYLIEALDRLTDNNLLYRLVIEGVTSKKGATDKAIGKISDPQLLSRIAHNQKLDFQTRARAAKAGNIRNPFGSRTLVCPCCGKAAIYKCVFESINSYQTLETVSCEHCGIYVTGSLKEAIDTFFIEDDEDANLRDSLIFICPRCGSRANCNCYPKPLPIPVILSQDSDIWGDVNLR